MTSIYYLQDSFGMKIFKNNQEIKHKLKGNYNGAYVQYLDL